MIVGGVGLFIVLIIGIIFFPVIVVGAGERGVVFNNVSGIEPRILSEGTHVRMPFVESVINMPIKTQATSFDENAGTQDSQSIDVKLTVNWHLNPAKVNTIYQQIGDIEAVQNNVLTNNVQDSIKAAISKYVALDIQRNRDNVASRALNVLQIKMKRYNVIVDNLSITNINFSDQFNAAIEQAQVANQHAIAAENEVKTAQANAQAAIAQADGQAKAQEELQQTLTPEILEKLWIEKWNGVLPQYSTSNLPIPVFNIGK